MIPVTCSCGQTTNAPDGSEGKRFKCPKCRQLVTVPTPALSPVSVVTSTASTLPRPSPETGDPIIDVVTDDRPNGSPHTNSKSRRRPRPHPDSNPDQFKRVQGFERGILRTFLAFVAALSGWVSLAETEPGNRHTAIVVFAISLAGLAISARQPRAYD